MAPTAGADEPLSVVALISGRGSNLKAIIDATQSGRLPVDIRAVISNRPRAGGLDHAREAGIPTRVLDHTSFATREAFDGALADLVDASAPGLVVLAGFMRILTPGFVTRYHGRLMNIHPSLLPALPGLDTHARALAAGLTTHGASIHFVTEAVDGGPLIVQATVPVLPADTPDALAARVLVQEHRIYPLAVYWFARGRLQLADDQVVLDGEPLATPVTIGADTPLPWDPP
jgi:phosphoribosylglycinamide formyltransferase-1